MILVMIWISKCRLIQLLTGVFADAMSLTNTFTLTLTCLEVDYAFPLSCSDINDQFPTPCAIQYFTANATTLINKVLFNKTLVFTNEKRPIQ